MRIHPGNNPLSDFSPSVCSVLMPREQHDISIRQGQARVQLTTLNHDPQTERERERERERGTERGRERERKRRKRERERVK